MGASAITGNLTGSVTEDTTLQVAGLVSVEPADTSASFFTGSFEGQYGTLTVTASGDWQYALDNTFGGVQSLAADAAVHDQFVVSWGGVLSGVVDITVHGNNDPASFEGDISRTLNITTADHVSGQVLVSDVDTGEKEIRAATGMQGVVGTFSIAADGVWRYDLLPGKQITLIDEKKSLVETFQIASKDGSKVDVSIQVSATLGVVDTTPPTVTTFNPANTATGVAIANNIVLTFNENIARGTGDIILKTADGTTVATYDAASSSNLSISGSTLTINPTKDLGIFTGYQVEIAAGAIKDMAGNNYAGESNYNFTTQTLDSLYHFSVVAFSAAPGATFMGQMAEAYNAGMTVKQIVEVFSTKPQFTSTYADSMTNADFATLLVANVVKDSASAATKAKAVDDIVSALMVWSRGETIYQIFGNLANMQLTDPDWGNTGLQFNNQTAVARHFTEVMHNSTTDMPTLKAIVGSVTPTTDVSTPEHIATLIGIEVPGMH